MGDEVLVSIIVLLYNNFSGLRKNINSIIQQDYANIEIVISDDCSDNYDEEFIRSLFKEQYGKFNGVILQSNKRNLGTVKNYNNAVKLSHGDIIVPLSADDYFIDSHVISDIVKYFYNSKCEVCTAYRRGAVSQTVFPTENDSKLLSEGNKNLIFDRLMIDGLVCGATLYFKRSLFDKLGGFDTSFLLIEDYPFTIKLVENDIKIHLLERTAIVYGEKGVSCLRRYFKSVNPLFSDDLNKILETKIFPNISHITSERCKRYLECKQVKQQKGTAVALLFILQHLNYIDVLFIWVKYNIKCMVKSLQKVTLCENIYWDLIK